MKCVFFDDNVVSYNKDRKIMIGAILVKENDTLLLPLLHKSNWLLAYSKEGDERCWSLLEKWFHHVKIYEITREGNLFLKQVDVVRDTLALKIQKKQAVLIELLA